MGYHIGKNGELTEFTRMICPDGGSAHIAVHPSGKFLLTAQYGGGSVALFPLDANGKLGEPTVTEHQGGSKVVNRRQDSPHPHWAGFSPDGKYALIPDLGLDQIVIYKVNTQKPAIIEHGVGQSVPGGGPRHMRFSTDGKFIYLLNELSLSVTTFAWDTKKGTAKRLTTTAAISEKVKAGESFNSAAEILVHPNGQFVYSSNRGHDTVSVYQANPKNGKLKETSTSPPMPTGYRCRCGLQYHRCPPDQPSHETSTLPPDADWLTLDNSSLLRVLSWNLRFQGFGKQIDGICSSHR